VATRTVVVDVAELEREFAAAKEQLSQARLRGRGRGARQGPTFGLRLLSFSGPETGPRAAFKRMDLACLQWLLCARLLSA
jgi:hypothetical protein